MHTGDLLFGIIETDFRNQITVIGPTMNFASRLEGEAEKDEILISEETESLVHDVFSSKRTINIKSWGLVNVYSVMGRKSPK
jgi:class 3 adenylate cyclase